MKKKLDIFIGAIMGTLLAHILIAIVSYTPPSKRHLCTCEYCKTVRQREAVEVLDSIIKERIVINISEE